MSRDRMRSVKSEESAVECNKKSPAAIGIAYRSRAFFVWELNLCAEIPRQNPFGAGKMSKGNTRFPAKTTFGGAKRPRTTQDTPPNPIWRGIPPPKPQSGSEHFSLFHAKCHMNVLTPDTMQSASMGGIL